MERPSMVAPSVSTAAAKTPKNMAIIAFRIGTPKINDATVPDQAPVIGKGMATKIKSAIGAQRQ